MPHIVPFSVPARGGQGSDQLVGMGCSRQLFDFRRSASLQNVAAKALFANAVLLPRVPLTLRRRAPLTASR